MLIPTLSPIIFFLGHAIRRDWICPLAILLGQSLRELNVLNLVDLFRPDSMSLLHGIEIQNSIENELDPHMIIPMNKTLSECLVETSHPSKEQLEMFRPKATEIFLSLPVKRMNPPGLCRSDRHIEYRELPFPPYPIVVTVINPQSQYIYSPIFIPEAMEYNPFSNEAFETIWSEVVFTMHMGGKRGDMRFRPSLMTFANRPGDRKLAAFVRDQIGNGSGTEIRVVDTFKFQIEQSQAARKRSLFEIMSDVEDGIVQGILPLCKFDEAEIRTPIEQTFYDDRIDIPVDTLLPDLQRLKEEGNGYFARGRIVAAQKCYTEAIDTIRSAVNTDDRIHQLLGTFLSNRAACLLKMVEGMSTESTKDAMKNVVSDCEIALKSKWSNVIPPKIRTKIAKRKDEAQKIINRLSSQDARSTILPQLEEQQQQQQQSQERPSPHAGGGRRRGRKKKKQRKRRQNNSRSSSHQQGDDSSDDNNDNGIDEDVPIILGKDLIEIKLASNATGSEDPCPCCYDRYSFELADAHTAVNLCGHAFCLPCLSSLRKKHELTKDSKKPISWTCPVCRYPLTESLLSNAASVVVDGTPSLKDRLTFLPLSETEKQEVANSLLLTHHFVILDVQRAIDAMLIDGLQSQLRQSKDLTPSEKQEIYEEARRPVNALSDEVKELSIQIRTIRDSESEEFIGAVLRVKEIQTVLIPEAWKNAQEYIWERMNSAGKMGAENGVTGEIEVDFHALHVHEAKELFDKHILPILEAVGSVLLVVGRGNHSEGKVSKLKPALQKHIEQHSKHNFLRHYTVDGNDGAIRVIWKK